LVCEEGFFKVNAINNMLVPHNSKIILAPKPQTILEKTWMFYTNCHRTNHNVETCQVKRKEDFIPIVFKVITQQIKV